MTDYLFATGGTGGHIFPALALAQEAERQGIKIGFIGQSGGMEAQLIPQAGFPFYGVTAGKWDRSNPKPLHILKALQGSLQAMKILRQLKPKLVLGFGGFASLPGIAAARLMGQTYVLHEGNAYPGLVTRWFSKQARSVILAHKVTKNHLSDAKNTVVLGYPVRETQVDKLSARRALDLPADGLITYVTGGSQGSAVLNAAVPEAYQQLSRRTIVLHSSGSKWEAELRDKSRTLSNYHVRGFVDATLAWAAADLAITRAGYGTLSEAAFHAVPCIMVPLPSAAENHQLHNAKEVAKVGAGWVVEESHLEHLSSVWNHALDDAVLAEAAQAASSQSPAGVARRILDHLASCVTGHMTMYSQESP